MLCGGSAQAIFPRSGAGGTARSRSARWRRCDTLPGTDTPCSLGLGGDNRRSEVRCDMHTLTRSVLLHSGFFVLMLFAVADVVTAQVSAAEREAGRAISTAFLLQITDPARTSG